MDLDVNIRKVQNGYILRYDDPKIRERNRRDDEGWEDPTKEVLASNTADALKGVQTILTKLSGDEELAQVSFDTAFNEVDDD